MMHKQRVLSIVRTAAPSCTIRSMIRGRPKLVARLLPLSVLAKIDGLAVGAYVGLASSPVVRMNSSSYRLQGERCGSETKKAILCLAKIETDPFYAALALSSLQR